ncbi:MAG: beta-galactosidase, partial [Lentisphaeria bacterium]|nr:beta-galactosidase [Lentisphaeria bacterium]
NTVGTATAGDGVLRVVLRAPADGKWPDFHLHSQRVLRFTKGRTYRCELTARAGQKTALRPAIYRVEGGIWTPVAMPPSLDFVSQVGLARAAGVNFVSAAVPSCWREPGEAQDWSAADGVMRQIIAANPEALVIARVGANAPGWWLRQHPEAVMTFENGKKGNKATVSCRAYREAAAEQMGRVAAHLAEAFPENFAGIHPAGQNTGEWFYDESWGALMSGYDVHTREAWREWLARAGEPGAAVAGVPAAADRHGCPNGFLRDPEKEREILLFDRFRQEEMADFVLALAAACRRATAGRKLVVLFYGYYFEFPPLRNGAPYSGHYALPKVLASPDIDVLCAPISYFDRGWPGTAPCMSPAESVMAAGKLWLNEDDTRTYLARTTAYGGVAD